MEFLDQLKELKLYKLDMDILDIGCDNGWFFMRTNKSDRRYDLIDHIDGLDSEIKNAPNVSFIQTSLLDFVPNKQYDLIFARNVFFEIADQIKEVARYTQYLKPEGVMCVSFLGENDPWVKKNPTRGLYYKVSKDEISQLMESYEVLWFQEFQGEFLRKDGTLKFWHLYQMIIKNK